MKTLLFISLWLFSLAAYPQALSFQFRKWNNVETLHIIQDSEWRLANALSHTGFNNSDTIKVEFDFKNEYVLVTHNFTSESDRITILSRQVLLHIAFLKEIAAHYKVQNLKIYVRIKTGLYLLFDDEEIRINGERVKVKDELFNSQNIPNHTN